MAWAMLLRPVHSWRDGAADSVLADRMPYVRGAIAQPLAGLNDASCRFIRRDGDPGLGVDPGPNVGVDPGPHACVKTMEKAFLNPKPEIRNPEP